MPAASLARASRGTIKRASSAATASLASKTDKARRAAHRVGRVRNRVDKPHRARKWAPVDGLVGTSGPADGTLQAVTRTPAGLIPATTLDRDPRPRQPANRLRRAIHSRRFSKG